MVRGVQNAPPENPYALTLYVKERHYFKPPFLIAIRHPSQPERAQLLVAPPKTFQREILRQQRCGYNAFLDVVCHGLDCERVHDVFADREAALDARGRLDRDMDAVVDVSFHDGQRFADVLFSFAMFRPHEAYPIPAVRTAVVIDQPERARDLHRWLPVFCERRPG